MKTRWFLLIGCLLNLVRAQAVVPPEAVSTPQSVREFVGKTTSAGVLLELLELFEKWEAGFHAGNAAESYPEQVSDPVARQRYLSSVYLLLSHSNPDVAEAALSFLATLEITPLPPRPYHALKTTLKELYNGTAHVSEEARLTVASQITYLYLITERVGGSASSESFVHDSFIADDEKLSQIDPAVVIAVAQASAVLSLRDRATLPALEQHRKRLLRLVYSPIVRVKKIAINALIGSGIALSDGELSELVTTLLADSEPIPLMALGLLQRHFQKAPLDSSEPIRASLAPVMDALRELKADRGQPILGQLAGALLEGITKPKPAAAPPAPEPPPAAEKSPEAEGPSSPSESEDDPSAQASEDEKPSVSGTPITDPVLLRQLELVKKLHVSELGTKPGFLAALEAEKELKNSFLASGYGQAYGWTYLHLVSVLKELNKALVRLKTSKIYNRVARKKRFTQVANFILFELLAPIADNNVSLVPNGYAGESEAAIERVRKAVVWSDFGEKVTVAGVRYLISAGIKGSFLRTVIESLINRPRLTKSEERVMIELLAHWEEGLSEGDARGEFGRLIRAKYSSIPEGSAFDLLRKRYVEKRDSRRERSAEIDSAQMDPAAKRLFEPLADSSLTPLITSHARLMSYFNQLKALDAQIRALDGRSTISVYERLIRQLAGLERMRQDNEGKSGASHLRRLHRVNRLQGRLFRTIGAIQELRTSFSANEDARWRERKLGRQNVVRVINPPNPARQYSKKLQEEARRGLPLFDGKYIEQGLPEEATKPEKKLAEPAPEPSTESDPSELFRAGAEEALKTHMKLVLTPVSPQEGEPKAGSQPSMGEWVNAVASSESLEKRLRSANLLRVVTEQTPLNSSHTITLIEALTQERDDQVRQLMAEVIINSLSSLTDLKFGHPDFVRFSVVVGKLSTSVHPDPVAQSAFNCVIRFANGFMDIDEMRVLHRAACVQAILRKTKAE